MYFKFLTLYNWYSTRNIALSILYFENAYEKLNKWIITCKLMFQNC